MFSPKKGFSLLKDIRAALKKLYWACFYQIGARTTKNGHIDHRNQGIAQFFLKLVSSFPWRRFLGYGSKWAYSVRQ